MMHNAEALVANHLRAIQQADQLDVKRMYSIQPLPEGGFRFLSLLVDARGEAGRIRYAKAREDGFCETKEEAVSNALQFCAKRYAAEVAQLAEWVERIDMVIEPFQKSGN